MCIVTCSVIVWTNDNKHAYYFKPDSEMLDTNSNWISNQKLQTRDKTKRVQANQKLSVFVVTCSDLVWTGDNKHAKSFKPNSCVTTTALTN
jgi:hypothetical protein